MENMTGYKPKKGEFFIVLSWTDSNDRSYIDNVLYVCETDGDLAVIERVTGLNGKFCLNLNRILSKKLSKDFVVALIGEEKFNTYDVLHRNNNTETIS